MKRKGFTLIELLAVIVVLAIIALIATPIVMNVIKNAQKGAVERSAERYVDAVETAIATDRLENGLVADGIYTVDADGNLVLGDKTLTVEVNGEKPVAGSKVAIENGQVVATGTSMTMGDYTVTINDKGSATATAKGDVVALCTAVGSNLTYEPGTEYSCDLGDGTRIFYVLKEDGDNVKLIMNENLGDSIAWTSSGDNSTGLVSAKAELAEETSGWTKLSQNRVTLPDARDIAILLGDANWDGESYLDQTLPTWMYLNLDGNNGMSGYWTSTPRSGGPGISWRVDYGGNLYGGVDDGNFGVRPVITISKTNMSL